ncbi:MAG TPA: hypothetical protein VLA59_08885 [Patescibacteria group bacterium]|nr:hypothetical protein [Patescibacteria group bacterium]
MDFSKLGQNEKLAVYGAAALIIGGILGYSYGLTALGILAAIAMLAVVFLPQLTPGVALPGSRGSLMVAVGGLAGVVMVLALLQAVAGVLFVNTNLRDLFFLVAVAGGVLMAWAGWQEFQAEGGRFQLGSSAPAATSPAAATAPAVDAAPAEPAHVERAEPVEEARTADLEAVDDDPAEPAAEDDRPVA